MGRSAHWDCQVSHRDGRDKLSGSEVFIDGDAVSRGGVTTTDPERNRYEFQVGLDDARCVESGRTIECY